MITFECVIEYGRQYPTLDELVYGKWGRFGHLGRPSRLSRLVFVLGLVPNVVQDHLHLFRDVHGAKERMNGEIPLGKTRKTPNSPNLLPLQNDFSVLFSRFVPCPL